MMEKSMFPSGTSPVLKPSSEPSACIVFHSVQRLLCFDVFGDRHLNALDL